VKGCGKEMDFMAIRVLSMAVSTLLEEMSWEDYGSPDLHTPVVSTSYECERFDMLLDMMGTLTRQLDTKIAYLTTEGKVIREWIEKILEISRRYQRELDLIVALKETAQSSPDRI
jgi:hypothetical protein